MSIHASVKLGVLYSPIIASPVFPRFTSQGLQGKEATSRGPLDTKNGSGRGDERMVAMLEFSNQGQAPAVHLNW